MDKEQEVALGNQAEMLKRDIEPYFDILETAILDKWKDSPIADIDGQHELRVMLKLLGDLKGNIQNVIDTGKVAKHIIEQENLIDKAKNAVRGAFR